MRRLRGIYALLLLGLAPLSAFSQAYVPKDLEGWQSWVLQDKPFLRCPFFANTAGTDKDNRLCALPGRRRAGPRARHSRLPASLGGHHAGIAGGPFAHWILGCS